MPESENQNPETPSPFFGGTERLYGRDSNAEIARPQPVHDFRRKRGTRRARDEKHEDNEM